MSEYRRNLTLDIEELLKDGAVNNGELTKAGEATKKKYSEVPTVLSITLQEEKKI
jgi:hypothetical protein